MLTNRENDYVLYSIHVYSATSLSGVPYLSGFDPLFLTTLFILMVPQTFRKYALYILQKRAFFALYFLQKTIILALQGKK